LADQGPQEVIEGRRTCRAHLSVRRIEVRQLSQRSQPLGYGHNGIRKQDVTGISVHPY
jgi:hypothetical protein